MKLFDDIIKRVERNFLVQNVRMQMKAQEWGMLGLNARDGLRDFHDGKKGWDAAPDIKADFKNNAKGMLQQSAEGLLGPTLLQYQHLESAEKMLAESPTGKELVESSQQGHVLTRLDTQMDAGGAYYPGVRILAINPKQMSFDGGNESYKASMTHVLGHEHFHAFQQRTRITNAGANTGFGRDDGGNGFTINDPREDILHEMHLEAAAHAVQIQVAYELQDKYPQVMKDLKRNEDIKPVIEAFEKEAERNPQSLENGRALRAAHDAWLQPDSERFHTYQAKAIRNWKAGLTAVEERLGAMPPERAADMVGLMGTQKISEKDMTATATMPKGGNHLALPGTPGPKDEKYNGAFLPRFEKELSGIYERMDGIRQKFSPTLPTPTGPSMATSVVAPAVPKMSGPSIGGKLGL